MTQENRLPGWLTLDADAALVRLASGTVQRVSVDTLTLRAPTVRDIRLAGKVAGDDAEERELQLFASLAQVSRQDWRAEAERLPAAARSLLSPGARRHGRHLRVCVNWRGAWPLSWASRPANWNA